MTHKRQTKTTKEQQARIDADYWRAFNEAFEAFDREAFDKSFKDFDKAFEGFEPIAWSDFDDLPSSFVGR